MTALDRQHLLRLIAEVTADVAAANELARRLAPWVSRAVVNDDVLIPAALLHHFFTAIETTLKRFMMTLEGSVPTVADSHAHLLAVAALEIPGTRPALISAEHAAVLRELLAFRHLFRQGYAANYRVERLRELITTGLNAWPSIHAHLEQGRLFVVRLARP